MTYTGLFLIVIIVVITIAGFIAAHLGEREDKKIEIMKNKMNNIKKNTGKKIKGS